MKNPDKQNLKYELLTLNNKLLTAVNQQGISWKTVLILILMIAILGLTLPHILLMFNLADYFTYIFLTLTILCVFIVGIFYDTPSLHARVIKHIQTQLDVRSSQNIDIESLWNNTEELNVAKIVNATCNKNLEWESESVFLPEDPLMLMMYTDDLEDVEFVQDIEEKFSMRFPDSYFHEKNFGDLKFKDVVAYILENKLKGALPASDK